ncbi:MAG: hypothetical protein ACHQK9_14890 [Reyranellales bacterium]
MVRGGFMVLAVEYLLPPPMSKKPSQRWTSLWQTPAAVMRTSTSVPVGVGLGASTFCSGLPNSTTL